MKNMMVLCLTLLALMSSGQEPYQLVKLWESPDILTTSESVCYYDAEKVLFVACIDGNPTDKDNNGFIAKLSLTGEVMTYRWATGINAPKGMGIAGNSLFVTDIDRVVEFNLASGEFIKDYPVEEAKFLNDITVGPDLTVYVSDMASNNIYSIANGNISLWTSSELFENPNGLNFKDGKLLVGTKNGIYTVDENEKSITHLVKDTGGIDGLELFDDTRFIISDWQGKVQVVGPNTTPVVLFNTAEQGINAADIAFVKERNLLLVPTFFDNRVMAYEVTVK